MQKWDHVIIGTGISGLSAAKELRRLSPGATVLLVGDDPYLPYKRTSLSKQLYRCVPVEELYLETSDFWETSGIDIMPDVAVTKIDPDNHSLELDDGGSVGWGKLLLATGSRPAYPENLSRHDISDSLVFRNWNDMETLYKRLQNAQSVLVSGMGILGIELTDQLVKMGKKVTLMGSGPQLLHKYISPRAAEILEEKLVQNNVTLRYLDEILSFSAHNAHTVVTTVHEQAPFDLLIFCTGSVPETEIARAAAILCKRGILVDSQLRTSKKDIFAAGDNAEHPDGRISQLWHESEHQGLCAGRIMAGSEEAWENNGFRMKCDAFENYAFSLLKPDIDREIPTVESEKNGRYIALYGSAEQTKGIVMVNDKDHAPIYQQAVREAWPHDKVMAIFDI